MSPPPAAMGALWSGTRDLHHACEAHAVGQRMLAGRVSPQEWADWLAAFHVVHLVIDRTLPAHYTRAPLLLADFAALPPPRLPLAAAAYAAGLHAPGDILGACYVLHAAHRRGGRAKAQVMRAAGLSTRHIEYEREAEVETFIRTLRDRADLIAPARAAFGAMLATMDEIEARHG